MFHVLAAIGIIGVCFWALGGFKALTASNLLQQARVTAGVVAISAAVTFTLRQMYGWAIPLLMVGMWLLGAGKSMSWPSLSWRSLSWLGLTGGRGARTTTVHLDYVRDNATGSIRGRVLKGVFAGRPLERMAPAELALLWRDCRFEDAESAELIAGWLDLAHPTWRDDMARAENEPGAGGIMTRAEALEILGLKSGASTQDVRRAHRDLIKKMHPDAGGSGYLAAKINEAKAALVGR